MNILAHVKPIQTKLSHRKSQSTFALLANADLFSCVMYQTDCYGNQNVRNNVDNDIQFYCADMTDWYCYYDSIQIENFKP